MSFELANAFSLTARLPSPPNLISQQLGSPRTPGVEQGAKR